MKIGLTYDLKEDYLKEGYSPEEVAEFDKPATIEGIENALHQLGHETERIGHAKHLMKAIVAGKRWDLVFNIAEGMFGYAREAVVPAILDVYQIPYTFSDPMTLAICLHKGMTKRVVRDVGVPTTDFCVVANERELSGCSHLKYPLFAKPVAEGTGKGIHDKSIIQDAKELKEVCKRIWKEFKEPAIVEPFLPGREFTVGMMGTGEKARVLGILEVTFNKKLPTEVYSFANKSEYEDRIEYFLLNDQSPLQKEIEKLCLDAWRGLECRDAGRQDIRLDANGKPMFMEVNPLAGIHPVDSDLPILCYKAGMTYLDLIRGIIDSAMERVKVQAK